MVISLVFILRKMSDKIPDPDAIHHCLRAFREQDPSVDDLKKLMEADSALSASIANDVKAYQELFAAEAYARKMKAKCAAFAAEAYVKELKAKCAAAAKLREEAKQRFDSVYAVCFTKITALPNSNA